LCRMLTWRKVGRSQIRIRRPGRHDPGQSETCRSLNGAKAWSYSGGKQILVSALGGRPWRVAARERMVPWRTQAGSNGTVLPSPERTFDAPLPAFCSLSLPSGPDHQAGRPRACSTSAAARGDRSTPGAPRQASRHSSRGRRARRPGPRAAHVVVRTARQPLGSIAPGCGEGLTRIRVRG